MFNVPVTTGQLSYFIDRTKENNPNEQRSPSDIDCLPFELYSSIRPLWRAHTAGAVCLTKTISLLSENENSLLDLDSFLAQHGSCQSACAIGGLVCHCKFALDTVEPSADERNSSDRKSISHIVHQVPSVSAGSWSYTWNPKEKNSH